jgi:two-component system, OmpR family, sensor histidine kinase VanS
MKTIRTKLFLYFMICMASFALLSIALNLIFLESYYVYRNKAIFLAAGERIAARYAQDPGGIADLLTETDRMEGVSSIIADSSRTIRYSSFINVQGKQKLPSELDKIVRENERSLWAGYVYTIAQTPDYNIREITYISALGSGDVLILRKPVTWIIESAGMANEFVIYTGLAIIALGGIGIYLLAKRITRPIIRMNETAKGIAKLDFDSRVDVRSRDEIGELGGSINQIADKLSVSLEGLRQDVERRKLLVRNMSHELKTPIGVIKGYAEGLRYGVAEDKEKFEKYCGVIADECDRMDAMIQELLHLSRLESGAFEMHRTPLDIPELTDAVIRRFLPAISEAGITLDVSCEPGLEAVADRSLMERLLSNLLSNAIHHTGGEKKIAIAARADGGMLHLSVANTGKPIAESETGRIWDVFYMSDKARTRSYNGHGLGLSIVKTIAELHGGTCGCENIPGGVRFFADIPL